MCNVYKYNKDDAFQIIDVDRKERERQLLLTSYLRKKDRNCKNYLTELFMNFVIN